MKPYPSISIVIPTYNEEQNIVRCLDSIFSQKYNGLLEVFIVDGGSADQTIRIAKKYPVRVLKNPFKQAEYGKKIGLMHAHSDFFMILDCDMALVGSRWFERMVEPLQNDASIIGSWTKFISSQSDAPLNKFITFDPIQRDPLFEYLTVSIDECVVKKQKAYWVLQYSKTKMLPAGFCLYRREQLLKTHIAGMKKYMELDTLVILLEKGCNRYAYVQDIGIHHPFLTTLGNLIRKRVRNLDTMYFNQPDKRYWTWIDWNKRTEFIRLCFWVFYSYSLVLPFIVGMMKCLRYSTWIGLYEVPFNVCTTTAIVWSFIKNSEGRKLLLRKNS